MHNFKQAYQYTKDLNILYVEDDKDLLESTSELLKDFFLTVTTAYDGQNGLEVYNEYKDTTNQYFDLVITDINMPRIDGMAMIKAIKNINQDQPIIVVSAYNESGRLVNLIQAGIANFVMKPIEANQLISMLYETCRNISNAKQKEQFLLSQAKLASMGEMIDSIAHQWLQPLNVISMQSSTLQFDTMMEKTNKDTITQYLSNQSNQINHLIETLNEFRGFFRPNYDLETTTYEELINSVLLLLKDSLIMHTIEIERNLNTNNNIQVISNEFKHILINIINNAIDAFNENNIEYDKRKIIFNSYIENNNNILTICDSAGGIPLNVIDNIFDANFTTKEKGTGVGLHMSVQIIEKIGGSLSVSNNDNGACFKITLKDITTF